MAKYTEDEAENEYGVFMTPDGTAYEFSRSTVGMQANIGTFRYQRVADMDALTREWGPTITAARELLKEPAAEA